jgi:ActR/RegA family two-component response regulator
MPAVTNVLILVSHDAFGERLVAFVRDQLNCTIAGLASNATAGLELARVTEPDVVLVDIGLQGKPGIQLVKPLVELHPSARIVLMGDGDSAEYVDAAAGAGAVAYLPKKAVSQRLPDLLGIPVERVTTSKLKKVTSQRGLVLEGALAGGTLAGGLAMNKPPIALAGAAGVLILSRWHSTRASRSSRAAGSAPTATTPSLVPAVDHSFRAEGVRGSPERRDDLPDPG